MTFDQFPLAGYDLARTHDYAQPDKPSALSRTFTGNSITSDGYSNHSFYVEVLSSDTSARSWVDGIKCADIRFDANTVATEVPARSVGDAAKACRIVYQNAVYLFLYTGTRNVGIIVQTNVIMSVPHPTDAEALEALAQLAERQITIIDQVAPRGPAMTSTSGAPPFQFTAPATLPAADAGKPYQPNGQPFSFCDPPTVGFTTPCGPMPATRNPSGGSPPYHFQYGTMGGFPPFGMALGKDGQLTGTPHPATGGKTYRFTVCTVDLKADFVCRDVSLTVKGAIPPTPIPIVKLSVSPTSAQAGTAVQVTGEGFTPGSAVTLTLGGTTLATGAADGNGSFSRSVTIPAQMSSGAAILTARDNAGKSATATIAVTAPPVQVEPPTVAITSATCVYLGPSTSYGVSRYEIRISGTASGPLRTTVSVPDRVSAGGSSFTANFGSWAAPGRTFGRREEGQPASTVWSVQFQIEQISSKMSSYGIFADANSPPEAGGRRASAEGRVTCGPS